MIAYMRDRRIVAPEGLRYADLNRLRGRDIFWLSVLGYVIAQFDEGAIVIRATFRNTLERPWTDIDPMRPSHASATSSDRPTPNTGPGAPRSARGGGLGRAHVPR